MAARSSKSHTRKRKHDHKHDLNEAVDVIKHYDTFYNCAPPGLIQEDKEHPEDTIPDLPENNDARNFLSQAPTKGLWMPLGKEVKVMKCWRCKAYGHRTGDKECPLFVSGNVANEQFRFIHEDPMHAFIQEKKKIEKEAKIRQLQALLESSSSDSSSSDDSSHHKSKKRHKMKKHKSKKKVKHKPCKQKKKKTRKD